MTALGRTKINMDDLLEVAGNTVRETNDVESSLDYFRDIEFRADEFESEGMFLTKEDKEAIIQDLIYFKCQVEKTLNDIEKLKTYEGD